jgi:hypothetical protein
VAAGGGGVVAGMAVPVGAVVPVGMAVLAGRAVAVDGGIAGGSALHALINTMLTLHITNSRRANRCGALFKIGAITCLGSAKVALPARMILQAAAAAKHALPPICRAALLWRTMCASIL